MASIQWHTWTSRSRFEILDPAGQLELARGGREGFFGRRYLVHGPRDEFLLELKLGFWGVAGQSAVTLPDGRVLTTKGSWLGRDFSVADGAGQPVARIVNTSRIFSFHQESLALELQAPVLSIVQAIGLARSAAPHSKPSAPAPAPAGREICVGPGVSRPGQSGATHCQQTV